VGVSKVFVISSDKGSSPINSYGMSKALVECLAVEANAFSVPRGTAVAVARWGNCLGSRGSVLHLWRQQAASGGPLTVTDERMTRFWLGMDEAVAWVLRWLDVMRGGEIFVPILPSARMVDLATAVGGDLPIKIVGRRAGGEKLHEQLLNEEEPLRTLRRDGYYVVTPAVRSWSSEPYRGEPVDPGLVYRSATNDRWLTVKDLCAMIKSVGEL